MLRLRDLDCRRGQGEQAFTLEVPDLSLAAGEVIAVTGRSGSGKSTLLEILGLVLRPHRPGVFTWRDTGGEREDDIAALWLGDDQRGLARIRARRIGFVLQTGGLLPYLNVHENIAVNRRLLGLPAADDPTPYLLDRLELTHLVKKKPQQLSIGERQRVSIARALAHGPSLLLADEPTAALDPGLADKVVELMVELVRGMKTTAVVATHEGERIRRFGAREVRARRAGVDAGYASRFQG